MTLFDYLKPFGIYLLLFEWNSSGALTTQEIVDRSRDSVVIVKQFGRDGSVDGIGAGFVISSNGLIATSLHVIGEARSIGVELAKGRKLDVVEIHSWDRKLDLAVLRVDATNLVEIPLGDSDALKQGEEVVAIGNPQGLANSVVRGVVSAWRDIDDIRMIQLAIPIEPGNSGGPLFDMQGRVEGVLTLKSLVTENLGFAMPINALKPLLEKPNTVTMTRWLSIGAMDSGLWSPRFGSQWTQKAGRITAQGLGTGFGGRSICISQKAVPEAAYEVAVKVRLDDEAGAAGLIFAADGEQIHYGFYPTAGQLRLTRFEGPDVFSWTILDQAKSAHYHPGDWNTLRVRVEPEKILCYVNEDLVIESRDTKLRQGKTGLAKFRQTRAEFQDFRIGTNLSATLSKSNEITSTLLDEIATVEKRPTADQMESLARHPAESRFALLDTAANLEKRAAGLRQLAQQVHAQSIEKELLGELAKDESDIDLFRAALLVAKLDNPDLDIPAYERQLAAMTEEVNARIGSKPVPEAALRKMVDYLFVQSGFHGSRSDYYNRANSYINEVLDEREGIPITLSVVVLELARRIQLHGLEGMPLPGHFMLRFKGTDGKAEWIDAFDGGKFVDASEFAEFSTMRPATKTQIIERMLRNLLQISRSQHSNSRSLEYLRILIGLAPDSVADHWSRAMIRYESGDRTGAKEDLRWLIEKQPPDLNLEQIEELYRAL